MKLVDTHPCNQSTTTRAYEAEKDKLCQSPPPQIEAGTKSCPSTMLLWRRNHGQVHVGDSLLCPLMGTSISIGPTHNRTNGWVDSRDSVFAVVDHLMRRTRQIRLDIRRDGSELSEWMAQNKPPSVSRRWEMLRPRQSLVDLASLT